MTARPEAWLLVGPTLRTGAPTAAQVRLERFHRWLGELGYEPFLIQPSRKAGWRAALLAVGLAPWLAGLAFRRRPALVLANSAVFAPALVLLKFVLGARVLTIADVMGLHSLEVDQAGHTRPVRVVYRAIWQGLEGLYFRAADLVLTINDRHARLVAARPSASIHVFRDAADAALTAGPQSDRAALGLPQDGVVVGYLGSLAYGRLDPLFAAWGELAAAGLHLLVVGDGPHLRRYEQRALDRGWLGTSVVFSGPLPLARAIAALRACDVAYTDCWSAAGFPAKVFEYMALGLPIVAEGRSQLREVLTDGEDALLHDPGGSPAAALLRLARDRELRDSLGGRARASFLAQHTATHRRTQLAALLGAPVPSPSPPEPAFGEPDRARPGPRLVSVVVPVLNAARTLGSQLDALFGQEHDGDWELLVADNGSTDGSGELAARLVEGRSNARWVDASAVRGPSHARNRGASEARGDFIAFADADDLVDEGWLAAMAAAARSGDLVAGRIGAQPRTASWLGRPFASGGNVGIWADVFAELGGFDETLQVGEDIDLCVRAQLAGRRLAFAPRASIQRGERTRLMPLARQQHSYGAAQALLYRRFGGQGPSLRRAVGAWARVVLRLPIALVSPRQRRRWVEEAAVRWGRLVGSVRQRVLYL